MGQCLFKELTFKKKIFVSKTIRPENWSLCGSIHRYHRFKFVQIMIQMIGMGPQRGVEFNIGINTKKIFSIESNELFLLGMQYVKKILKIFLIRSTLLIVNIFWIWYHKADLIKVIVVAQVSYVALRPLEMVSFLIIIYLKFVLIYFAKYIHFIM